MKKVFTATISFLLLACSFVYSQEFAVMLRFKTQEDVESFRADTSVMKTLSTEHKTRFYQSCYGAKNPELLQFFTLRGNGNRDAVIKEYFATGKFDKNFIHLFDIAYTTAPCPNPVQINDPHSVANLWQLDMIEARCAWAMTQGSSDVLIGIADTDFDLTQQDLQNKYEYVTGPVSAGHYHGTSVASIAGAQANNGIGIAGIGYNCKIAAHRVRHTINSWGEAQAYQADIFDAIWYLYQSGIKVINASWSGTGLLKWQAEEMTQNGTTLVLSGGNTPNATNHSDIADIPGVIVVSSVNRQNMHGPTGHAHNEWIDICALGNDVVVARPNNTYFVHNGTSFAAPFVTGTVALLLSLNSNLTPADIEYIIKSSAKPIQDGYQYPGLLGAGLLNVRDACAMVYCFLAVLSGTYPEPPETYKRIFCKEIVIQNATIPAGSVLELKAANRQTTINDIIVEDGATFIVE